MTTALGRPGGPRWRPPGRRSDGAIAAAAWRELKVTRGRAAVLPVHHAAQDLPGDDEALNFARPLPDLADLGVPHHPLDRVFRGVAVAAEDLDRLGGDPHGELGAEELGHRRLLLERLAGLLEEGGVVQEVAPR